MKETVKITGLDHYGRGISKLYEKTVFIENALVDEEVKIAVFNNKKNYCEAIVSEYIKQSNSRIKPNCSYYDECGGCNIMHMNYASQLTFKENKVKEILKKFANVDFKKISKIIPTKEFNYRNKITLQVNKKIGLYKKSSYEIVNIDGCLISDIKINKIIEKLNQLNLKNVNQIIIRTSDYSNEIMVVICIYNKIDEKYFIEELKGNCTSIIKKYKKEFKTIYGTNYITEKTGDYLFKISPDSFFQVNNLGMYQLYELVKEYADLNKDNTVLDLYCGTGTIGIYLSNQCKKVIGVEINKYAMKDAFKNKELNNVNNIDFICDDVSNVINQYKNINVIVVDPPRNGLAKEVIENMIEINPEKIIYVSCDPVTLARDIKLLDNSYEVKKVTPVDMFPNTHHVECVVLLQKKS